MRRSVLRSTLRRLGAGVAVGATVLGTSAALVMPRAAHSRSDGRAGTEPAEGGAEELSGASRDSCTKRAGSVSPLAKRDRLREMRAGDRLLRSRLNAPPGVRGPDAYPE